MRVFSSYIFDLKERILFKDTMSFVEDWLSRQGIVFDNMAFMLDVSQEDLYEKTVGIMPELTRYRRKYCFGHELTEHGLRNSRGELLPFRYEISSVPQNWPENTDIHVRKEDEQLVRSVIRKIPRPINPSFSQIVLDNVHWFPKINMDPAIADNGRHSSQVYPTAIFLRPYFSNNIALQKSFDHGTKHNIVIATIERTKSSEELLEDAPIVKRLAGAFGAYNYNEPFIVILDDSETQVNKKAEVAIKPIVQSVWDELQPEQTMFDVANKTTQLHRVAMIMGDGTEILAFPERINFNVSIKEAVIKNLEPLGFSYRHVPSFTYECVKKNKYNHTVEIGFTLHNSPRTLEYSIIFRGYNYFYRVPLRTQKEVPNQRMADAIVKKIAEIATLAEERLAGPLYEFYGKSPKWF